jgi:hypothetical protein
MSYFFYTLLNGFRLYLKSSFYLVVFSFLLVMPASYLLFELNVIARLLEASGWLVYDLIGLRENRMADVLYYCFAISILYVPASIWIACCHTTCLALSHGYFPKFGAVARTTFARASSVLVARTLAQGIILVPICIISFFTSKFPHILPMYGSVIVPAIAYFTLYLSLRYAFVEVIVIAENASPIKALTLCNRVTDGATLRIFLLQQSFLLAFFVFNVGIYAFLDVALALPESTLNLVATTILGTIDSFYLVITFCIYVSFAAGESYSRLEENSAEIFSGIAKTGAD